MKTVRFLRPAEDEMLDAAWYYELQAPGLGGDLLDKIDSAVRDIAEHPERWPVILRDVRRRLIHRFPLVHEYDQVDLEQVWKVLTDDLPELLRQIEPLLPRRDDADQEG